MDGSWRNMPKIPYKPWPSKKMNAAHAKYLSSKDYFDRINTAAKAFVQVSPNPYMDKLNVNFVSNESGKAEVRLMSASGHVVRTAASAITRGYNNIQLQALGSQAGGLYIADIIINGTLLTSIKVLKQ